MKHHFQIRQAAAAFLLAVLLGGVTAGAAEPTVKSVSTGEARMVVPCGTPFGIKIFTNGVVVVGTADLETGAGVVNPAREADIRTGDIIVSVDGKAITSNEQLSHTILSCSGRSLTLGVVRNGQKLLAKLSPVQSTGCYRAGLWVRDSAAGVGTLTYYDPQNGTFAGLGHGITDPDTNELIPFGCGDVVPVTISGIQKGVQGVPGELQGYFDSDIPAGTLYANSLQGVFGTLNHAPQGRAVPVCPAEQVKTGPAEILCTIDGKTPKTYQAEIELLNTRVSQSKNMILHVTDTQLIQKTGGIVQGMSGSPILQNGKLVGAVTHVFVNDPTRGYGILADHMLTGAAEAAQKAAS
ncbi:MULTISPECIES: SpoIVB peptidase [Caproicibacterium]|uniref:SpoIVB peptidase n=1 Tax=Caproicibacterium argilliputei TaxID=3030016 RepID=A0AA97DC34_9FIRM|nr:SpoIVB peptidase [Caproicibacterium argilliputei]WOC33552.1 SpoIVB peptidase [Caproicibacterium argilliputei]